jgi:drug/metabolite transporter (DMT)-like permease
MAKLSVFNFIISSLLLCSALQLFKSISSDSIINIAILCLANFFNFLILSMRPDKKPLILNDKKSNLCLLGWATGYVVVYFLYLYFPKNLHPSNIVLIKCIAPTLALFFSNDWKLENLSPKARIQSFLPLILLFLIYVIERPSDQGHSTTNIILFLAILISFVLSQTSTRVISKSYKPFELTRRVSLLISMLFLIMLLPQLQHIVNEFKVQYFLYSFLLSLMIIMIQLFNIVGIQSSPPSLSALFMSSIVPISLIWDFGMGNTSRGTVTIALSALYCVLIWVKSRSKKNHKVFSS